MRCGTLAAAMMAAGLACQEKTAPAPLVRSPSVIRGEQLFQSRRCVNCHTIGHSKIVGPDLAAVGRKRTREWLVAFIEEPRAIYIRRGGAPLDPAFAPMPTPVDEMPHADAVALADYLVFETAK